MLYKNAKNIDGWIRLYLKKITPIGDFQRKKDEINELIYITKRPLTQILDEFRDAYMESNERDVIVDIQENYYMEVRMKMDFGYFTVKFIRETSIPCHPFSAPQSQDVLLSQVP